MSETRMPGWAQSTARQLRGVELVATRLLAASAPVLIWVVSVWAAVGVVVAHLPSIEVVLGATGPAREAPRIGKKDL